MKLSSCHRVHGIPSRSHQMAKCCSSSSSYHFIMVTLKISSLFVSILAKHRHSGRLRDCQIYSVAGWLGPMLKPMTGNFIVINWRVAVQISSAMTSLFLLSGVKRHSAREGTCAGNGNKGGALPVAVNRSRHSAFAFHVNHLFGFTLLLAVIVRPDLTLPAPPDN